MTIVETWSRIESHLATIAPGVLATLNPPTSLDAISQLERETGLTLTDDLVESLRTHNGQSDPNRLQLLTKSGTLLSAEQMVVTWRFLNQINEEISPKIPVRNTTEWWNRVYLPITDFEGDCLGINLGFNRGEIIQHVHDGEIEHNCFSSFGHWLRSVLKIFDERQFIIEDGGFINFWPEIEQRDN
jgi:cell wall assembly regulator SMI1